MRTALILFGLCSVTVMAFEPNDALFSKQYGLLKLGMPYVWKHTHGSSKVTIAVIDTGVQLDHEDLRHSIWKNPGEIGQDSLGGDKASNGIDDDGNGYIDDWRGWDFGNADNDPSDVAGHGTICGGIITAKGNNEVGIAGVAWDAKLMALKVFTDNSELDEEDDVSAAVRYAVNMGAAVVNMSLGLDKYSKTLFDAVEYAREKGVLVVASAGNDGRDNDQTPQYPANFKLGNVLSVAATDAEDKLTHFSNFGKETVHLAAPGWQIPTTDLNHKYLFSDGTSEAAPHVAGAAAILKAIYPAWTYEKIRERLIATVDKRPELAGKMVSGGRLNLRQAIGRREQ
ncbi:MAG: S8 family serine peptidase [Bdellovibrionales bacterium]|nr:S8 family serine peptidase [Bdellovibrionales bacterium]